MPCLLFPPLTWWIELLRNGEQSTLFTGRNFGHGHPQNRYRIVAANGPLLLSVPLKGGRRNSAPINETAIDYKHAWQRQHWRTLLSAYGRAPFFEHFGPELEALIFSEYQTLLDFNLASIDWLRKSMRLNVEIKTIAAVEEVKAEDRQELHSDKITVASYSQVFDDRFGFVPDLSAIDLLMNEGPYSAEYLKG